MNKSIKTLIAVSAILALLSPIACLDTEKWKQGPNENTNNCPWARFGALIPLQNQKNLTYKAHDVTTQDGYVLTVFELSNPDFFNPAKDAVLLQHGINSESDTWLLSKENSIAAQLVKQGYKVFLGNNRGNAYSSVHKTLTPDQKEFWNFSFHELGTLDQVAQIQFILNQTGKKDLIYIGHSQGTSQMFAGLSDKSSKDFLNSKVKHFIALAPVPYLANYIDPLLAIPAKLNHQIKFLANKIGLFKYSIPKCVKDSVYKPDMVKERFTDKICKLSPRFCGLTMIFTSLYSAKVDDMSLVGLGQIHSPGGTSVKSLLHFSQQILEDKQNPKMYYFDFGKEGNMKNYSQEIPPTYDFGNIRTKVTLFAGTGDTLADFKDSAIVLTQLKNSPRAKLVTMIDYGHSTYLVGKNPLDIARKIIAEIEV